MRKRHIGIRTRKQRSRELKKKYAGKQEANDPDMISQSNRETRTSTWSPPAIERVGSTGQLDASENLYNHGAAANDYPRTSTGISTDKYLHGVLSDSTDASSRAMWRSFTDDERTFGEGEADRDDLRSPCVSFRNELEDQDNEERESSPASPRSPSPLPSILRSPSSPTKSAKGKHKAAEEQPSRSSSPFAGLWSTENQNEQDILAKETSHGDGTSAVPSTADSNGNSQVSLTRAVSLRKEHFEPKEVDLEDEGVEVVDGRLSSQTFKRLRKKFPGGASTTNSMSSMASNKQCTPVGSSTAKEPMENVAPSEKHTPEDKTTDIKSVSAPGLATSFLKTSTEAPTQNEDAGEPSTEDEISKVDSKKEKIAEASTEEVEKNEAQENKSKNKKRGKSKTRKQKEMAAVPQEIAFDADKQDIPMPRSRTNRSAPKLVITEEIENNSGGRDLDIIDIAPMTTAQNAVSTKSANSIQPLMFDTQPVESNNHCSAITQNDDIAKMVGAMSCPTDFGLFGDVFQSNDAPEKNAREALEYVKGKQDKSLLDTTGFSKASAKGVLCEECIKAGENKTSGDGKVCHNCLMLRVRSTVGASATAKRAERSANKNRAKFSKRETKDEEEAREPKATTTVNLDNTPDNVEHAAGVPAFSALVNPRDNCFEDPKENVERMCALFPKRLMSAYNTHLEGEADKDDGCQHLNDEFLEPQFKSKSLKKKARERGPVPISEIEFPMENDPGILRTVSSLTAPRRKKNQKGAKQRSVKLPAKVKQAETESRKTDKKRAGRRKFFSGGKKNSQD